MEGAPEQARPLCFRTDYTLLCEPSQNGGVFVRLQPHQAITLASGQTVSTGESDVPACEPSQNGCDLERPQAHHHLLAPAASLVT